MEMNGATALTMTWPRGGYKLRKEVRNLEWVDVEGELLSRMVWEWSQAHTRGGSGETAAVGWVAITGWRRDMRK